MDELLLEMMITELEWTLATLSGKATEQNVEFARERIERVKNTLNEEWKKVAKMQSEVAIRHGDRLRVNIEHVGVTFSIRTIDEGDEMYVEIFDLFNTEVVYTNHFVKDVENV